jgi:tetratricopeptide (TPR) repeat protein
MPDIYRTTDNREFDNRQDAERHQERVDEIYRDRSSDSSSSSSYTPSSSGSTPALNFGGEGEDFNKIVDYALSLLQKGRYDEAIKIYDKCISSFSWEPGIVESAKTCRKLAENMKARVQQAKAEAEADASRGSSSSEMFSAVSIPANASANELSKLAIEAYTAKDFIKAIALWRKAEEKGCTNIDKACYSWTLVEVGNTAFNAQNYVAAFELYRKAADMGNPSATNNLGELYRDGMGVPKDLAKAKELFTKAVKLGSENAKGNLAKLG